jgi:hypothetical protein
MEEAIIPHHELLYIADLAFPAARMAGSDGATILIDKRGNGRNINRMELKFGLTRRRGE